MRYINLRFNYITLHKRIFIMQTTSGVNGSWVIEFDYNVASTQNLAVSKA